MTPSKFRKKPVVIEAVQFFYTKESLEELQKFCGPALRWFGKDRHPDAIGWAHIFTLEDGNANTGEAKHIATEGDWIIKGVQGEFYPCKPDIFEATYERVYEEN